MKYISKIIIPIIFTAVCIVCVELKIQYNKISDNRDYYKLLSESIDEKLESILNRKFYLYMHIINTNYPRKILFILSKNLNKLQSRALIKTDQCLFLDSLKATVSLA